MAQESSPVIECHKLVKIYENGVRALDELNLVIEPGTSFGLMGENGAGKSTLVRLLLGFVFPTSGELRVLGQRRVQQVHPKIGYLHERPFFELRFTGRHYLGYLAQISGLSGKAVNRRIEEVLELVDLAAAAGEKMTTYSKGMLQRIGIAQALLTDPPLLILDEPTSGLDPYSQWKVRQIINTLRQQGKTVFLCSHYLPEVEMLCDTVGILQRGKLARYGTVNELLGMQNLVEFVLATEESAAAILEQLNYSGAVQWQQGNRVRVPVAEQAGLLALLVANNIRLHSLNPVSRSLEEVYLSTTPARLD